MNKREQENSLLQDKIQIQEKKAGVLVKESVESLKAQSKEEMSALLKDLHQSVKQKSEAIEKDLTPALNASSQLKIRLSNRMTETENLGKALNSYQNKVQESITAMEEKHEASLKKIVKNQFSALLYGTIVSWVGVFAIIRLGIVSIQ